jgi:type II secretory pathway pseudopilin PulG
MKLNFQPGVRRHERAFTLAEVVAALLFMAIVIPVAVEGLRIASQAGESALRKEDAARVADRILAENLVTTNWSQAEQNGSVREADREYRWSLRNQNWSEDNMHLLSIEVTYALQGRDQVVRLSTLAPSN